MISKDDDHSPPERDRTANRRWMIGIVVSLVFGIFGAVMAVLSYLDRDQPATIQRTPRGPAAAPPAATPAPSGTPAPTAGDKGKGNDKN